MAKKILAAMSGGVDSSMAAALLSEQGYLLAGATMRMFTRETQGCGSGSDAADAAAVCARMGIGHFVIDAAEPFEREVIARFETAYAAGRTPNPCIDCNRHLKFGLLLERALELGFDGVATGHYARIERRADGCWLLKKAADPAKDQSYVLYSLTQRQLARTLLPLGELSKEEVRALARQRGFENADRPDSQDICFIPDGDYGGYLERVRGLASPPGDFIDPEGNVLGRHKGQLHYTIGQRRGLGVSGAARQYVVARDAQANTVTLGPPELLLCSRFTVEDCNWISVPAPEEGMRVSVRTRYHQTETPAVLHLLPDGGVEVVPEAPLRAVTPGQAAVFYDGELVVGGGTIASGERRG